MLGWKVFGAGVPGLQAQAMCKDVATSVAAAGTTQGAATELTAADSEVTTVADGAGVALSTKISAGDEQTVFNAGSSTLRVYPPSGMQINALAANQAMLLGIRTGCLFKCVSTTRIFGILSA